MATNWVYDELENGDGVPNSFSMGKSLPKRSASSSHTDFRVGSRATYLPDNRVVDIVSKEAFQPGDTDTYYGIKFVINGCETFRDTCGKYLGPIQVTPPPEPTPLQELTPPSNFSTPNPVSTPTLFVYDELDDDNLGTPTLANMDDQLVSRTYSGNFTEVSTNGASDSPVPRQRPPPPARSPPTPKSSDNMRSSPLRAYSQTAASTDYSLPSQSSIWNGSGWGTTEVKQPDSFTRASPAFHIGTLQYGVSLDGHNYLPIPSVVQYVTLGSSFVKQVTDDETGEMFSPLLQFGALCRETVFPRSTRCLVPKIEIIKEGMKIQIVHYNRTHFNIIARLALDWYARYPNFFTIRNDF